MEVQIRTTVNPGRERNDKMVVLELKTFQHRKIISTRGRSIFLFNSVFRCPSKVLEHQLVINIVILKRWRLDSTSFVCNSK